MKKELMKKFIIEERGTGSKRTILTFKEKNKAGESLVIEMSATHYIDSELKNKKSLPQLWKKYKYTNHLYKSYININTYVTDEQGNCYGRYNPTTILVDNGKREILNFRWVLEDTEENAEKLIDETVDRFLKMERIKIMQEERTYE